MLHEGVGNLRRFGVIKEDGDECMSNVWWDTNRFEVRVELCCTVDCLEPAKADMKHVHT